jgi:hypothetical protein
MARYTIGDAALGQVFATNFGGFIEIVKGRSIVSALDGDDRIELGLSGDLMIRVFDGGKELHVNLISTTNPDEIPPIALALGDLPQRVPMHVIEDKLNGLRTLYAIYFLTDNDRTNELTEFLRSNPDGDIERILLGDEDRLYIESISYGSWVVTIWSKTKSAYKSISSVAGMVFERSRESYLRKVEAEAAMLENQAQKEAIHAARENFELQKSQMDYLLDVSNKIDAPEIREVVKRRIMESVDKLVLGDPEATGRMINFNDSNSVDRSKMLPPPK